METFDVVETFVSINGEGRKAGELSTFIRLKGCNLNCDYCDTKWANESNTGSEKWSTDKIYEYIKNTGVRNVTLTGGEPLFRKGMRELLAKLNEDSSLSVEIETNGSVDLTEYADCCSNISFTVDYKLPVSNMEDKMCLKNFEFVRSLDTVKFVSGSFKDLAKAKEIIDRYNLTEKTVCYISPVFGKINPEDIVNFMKDNLMNKVRLQLQLHKFIWDPNKKGV